jgi:hypothetical protein
MFSAESRQKRTLKKPNILIIKLLGFYLVGVAGFEPATSSSQTRRDDRATLHPDFLLISDSGTDLSTSYSYSYFNY